MSKHRIRCPHCHRELEYERIHTGFSDLGFMYCDQDETVVTWDSYDETYARIALKHPWTLDAAERQLVVDAMGPCTYGGKFSFDNVPRCPHCNGELPELGADPTYFVVLGRRLDAARDGVWLSLP
jgi:hypothetical protein